MTPDETAWADAIGAVLCLVGVAFWIAWEKWGNK